nr:hypothetical protein Hi04_10k_c1074_00009 [uncultured bacterium]
MTETPPEVASASRPTGPELSVIICTYNRYDLLPDAVDSLRRQDAPTGAVEIIVVDNSPDQTRAEAFGRQYSDVPGLTYLREARPGLANARNVGVTAARSRIVAFIDDDARAAPGWAAAIAAAHAAYAGRAAIVGGRVLPSWAGEKPGWLGPKILPYLSVTDLGEARRELAPSEFLPGCNLSFEKSALLAAGGFATGLGRIGPQALLSSEELEITTRIRETGKIVVYAPDAVVEHIIHADRLSQEWFRRRAAWQAVSDLLARPEDTRALAAKAATRLAHPVHGWRRLARLRERSTADQVWRDMTLFYDVTIFTLCGGKPSDGSNGAIGRARDVVRSMLKL